jgi:hypothetical protein
VALASDICSTADDCEIDTAGIMCIFASILWAISGCTTLALEETELPAPAIAFQMADIIPATTTPEEVETETNTLSPDGTLTKIHTTTITNPDGSKTVTETTEVTPSECK